METTNLIQSTARVVKITSLKKGDLIKYMDTEYSSVKTYYGIVTDLMNSGEKSFIEFLLYKNSYGDFETEIKTFTGDKNLDIFPATLEEIQDYFKNIEGGINKKIETKKDELYKLEKGLKVFKEFTSGEASKKLSTPDYVSITQEEYNENKRLKEEKKKQLLQEVDNNPF